MPGLMTRQLSSLFRSKTQECGMKICSMQKYVLFVPKLDWHLLNPGGMCWIQKPAKKNASGLVQSLCLHALTSTDRIWWLLLSSARCIAMKIFASLRSNSGFRLTILVHPDLANLAKSSRDLIQRDISRVKWCWLKSAHLTKHSAILKFFSERDRLGETTVTLLTHIHNYECAMAGTGRHKAAQLHHMELVSARKNKGCIGR